MGFWPYLRHAHRSVDTPPSATGTSHTTFFSWLFLLYQIKAMFALGQFASIGSSCKYTFEIVHGSNWH
jgi:hypothetical protein